MANFDGTDDFFDSCDVIARIEEIEAEHEVWNEEDELNDIDVDGMEEDEREEYTALLKLREEAERDISDWSYGETFISESHFEDYAEEMAYDIGAINREASWPLNRIDWAVAANDLKIDYTSFEFRGTTYYAR